jgi:hypothetical protein
VHPIWRGLLQSSTDQYLGGGGQAQGSLSARGLVPSWHLRDDPLPGDMPAYFARLGPGYYYESKRDAYDTDRSHAGLVTSIAGGSKGRIVMAVEITDLEDYQNKTALISVVVTILSGLIILGSILWPYISIRRPVQSLA